jgi:diguanylate cyclase (GGDEF)-like protein
MTGTMSTLPRDELTGAYRREGLRPSLNALRRESVRTGAPLSLAVVDVDHFKTLNDGFGHAVGDRVLREVAERIVAALRDEDLVFRYGGDEFVVLLPGTPLAEAVPVIERVRRRVRRTPIDAGVQVRVHLSVGLACTADVPAPEVPSDLFERADARLLRAKRRGRDRLAADDQDASDGTLPETRLLGRDGVLTALEAYLDRRRERDGSGPSALRLSGPRGAGFTRLLHEAASRAELRGRTVRRLVGTPADEGVHLGAWLHAFSAEEGRFDLTEETLRERLRREADASGLVLLVEGGARLDPDGRTLLQELAARPGVWTVEACPDGERPALGASDSAVLAPLERGQLEAWFRAVLGGALEDGLVEDAHAAGGGLPGPTARWLRRGRRTGALRAGPIGWRWDRRIAPRLVHEEAHHGRVRVPTWDGPLVGRAALLARLRVEVAEERLVVLVGPGGIGKSRLAAQLAHLLADDAPGGTDWIDLRGVRSGSDLVGAIARTLRLGSVRDVGELARKLDGAPRRLVLDDAERLAPDAGRLAELRAALPELRLLVTARRPLRLEGERIVEVDGLGDARQGAALLRRRIRRTAGAAALPDPATEEALLRHLGGSPLAIELAAAWTAILPPDELLEALERRPGLLGDAPGQQARAAETIDLTRELMAGREREMLGTLALLEDGFEAEEARRAVDASPFFLLALLDRALLRRDGPRYRMHPLVAERFAQGLRDRSRAQERVAGAYAALAARLEAMEGDVRSDVGYRRVDAEIDNLRLAWTASLRPPRPDRLWPLAKLLRGYFDVRGRYRDGLETFRTADAALAEAADGAQDDAELRAWSRESVGLFLTHRGEHAAGARAASEALSLLEDRGSSECAALAHNTLGIAHAYLGDVDGARAAFEAAAATRRMLGDAVGEAQAHGNVALLLEQAGRADEAVPALRAAIAAHRDVGHASGLSLALTRLALIERRRGDEADDAERLESALALALEARDVAARIGFASALEQAESEVAETLLRLDRPDEGLEPARSALVRAAALEANARERLARLRLGRLELAAGRIDAARGRLERLEAAGGDGEEDRRGRLLLAAEIARSEGRTVDAARLLGASEADGGDADLARWWRRVHDGWRASLGERDATEAEAAFLEGRRRGPAGLRATVDERRTTGG